MRDVTRERSTTILGNYDPAEGYPKSITYRSTRIPQNMSDLPQITPLLVAEPVFDELARFAVLVDPG
jgi:hypothetical protein